jgi:hypothetical protein
MLISKSRPPIIPIIILQYHASVTQRLEGKMNSRSAPPSPGTLQRQERNRSRHGRPFHGYGFGENVYSDYYHDHFTYDPRMRPVYGFGGLPRGHRAGRPCSIHEDDSDGDETLRQSRAESRDSVTFGKAMTKLHQQISKSETFYNDFKSGYDRDIEGIKRYATEENLLSLWTLRVKGKKDPKAGGNQDGDDDLIEMAEKFPSMKRKLREALAEALCSIFPEGKGVGRKGEIRLNSAKRLKDKVVLAHSQILSLLDLVPKGPEHCEALLDELEKLKTLVNPEIERNKELYKGGDCEGAGGASGENGGGEQAQGW